MLDERVERLLTKAEEAADRNEVDQADMFRVLADQAAYHARKEAKAIERMTRIAVHHD